MRRLKSFILLGALLLCASVSRAQDIISFPVDEQIQRIQSKECKGGFTFAVMTDSHASAVIHPLFLALARDMGVDFIVNDGDMTNNGLEEEYKLVIGQVTQNGIPWLPVPGNHEFRSPEGRTTTTGRVRYKKIFGKDEWSFEYCGWKFIALDVVAMDTLSFGQMKWLEKEISGAGGKAAVFMHYPPGVFEGYEGYFTGNAQNFVDLLQKYGVQLSFYGHFHNFDRIITGPTTHFVAGSAGGGVDPKDIKKLHDPAGGSFFGFLLVSITGDKALVSIIRPMGLPPEP